MVTWTAVIFQDGGGGGGEYGVVEGFGWTNGVAMHFLDKYKDEDITPWDEVRSSGPQSTRSNNALLSIIIVTSLVIIM